MIAHKGENVIIGSVFRPINGAFNIADYVIRCVVTNIHDEEVCVIEDTDIIRNNAENAVACTIGGSITSAMNGLYFISFELWSHGQNVLSNEVEQLTIVD